MHQAALARRDSAGWTGDGGELFRRQVAHPHQDKMPENKPKNCSKWHSSVPNWVSKTVDPTG